MLILAATYAGGAFVLFNTAGFCLKLLSPNLALLASGGVGLVWERVVEQRERLRVRRTLERYVSRDVVKEVLDNPESYLNTLEGVSRRPITVLFSDVRGFTAHDRNRGCHAAGEAAQRVLHRDGAHRFRESRHAG